MTVYEAINEMRRISSDGGNFSFSFMSYDSSRNESVGIVTVAHGRLRKRESERYNRYAEMMEGYVDLDTLEFRHFYQPLLMTFNGIKLTL